MSFPQGTHKKGSSNFKWEEGKNKNDLVLGPSKTI